MDVSKLINVGDFCQVASDKFVKFGVKRNHFVYIAGSKALPVSENDPYTQRVKFFVHRTEDNHVIRDKMYLMDPDSLTKVGKGKQKQLTDILRKDIEPLEDSID